MLLWFVYRCLWPLLSLVHGTGSLQDLSVLAAMEKTEQVVTEREAVSEKELVPQRCVFWCRRTPGLLISIGIPAGKNICSNQLLHLAIFILLKMILFCLFFAFPSFCNSHSTLQYSQHIFNTRVV